MTAEQKQQEPFHWRTGIAYKTRDQIVVRDYDLNDLAGNLDLSEMASNDGLPASFFTLGPRI